MHPGHCGGCLRPDWGFGLSGQRKCSMVLRERVTRMALEARADPARRNGAIERVGGQLGGNPEALRTWVRAEEQGGRNERGDVTRGAAPVAWHCTRCVVLHPLRGGTPDQIGCNAYGSGVPRSQTRMCVEPGIPQRERKRPKRPLHKPRDLAGQSRGDMTRGAVPVAWRCTRCVVLHPLRGGTPDQIGCNAYGLGAMPTDRVYRAPRQERVRNLESRNAKESGLNTPTRNRGLGRPATARDARAFEKVKALRDLRSV